MNNSTNYRKVQHNIYAKGEGKDVKYRARKVVNGRRMSFSSPKLKIVREWLKSIS